MARQLTALGGDIFAGLFTYGIKQAGYKVLGHLEHTTYGTKTARLNFPDLDIRNGTHTWNPREYTGKVDFMYTNPPCAAWSAMQVSSPWQDHTERLAIVRDLVAAGQIIRPKAWCWESVTGAWKKGREFVLEQAESWMAHGYHTTVLLEDAKYLGANQNRQRMFLLAHQYPLVWPAFTVAPTTMEVLNRVPRKLRGKGPLLKMPESLRELYNETNHGGSLRHVLIVKSDKEQARLRKLGPRPAMTMHRMRPDQAPRCFIGCSNMFHPYEARYLSWYECLALVGLPMDWQTSCNPGDAASLELSRAVMPAVGKWVGQAVADGITAGKKLKAQHPKCHLVDFRNPDYPSTELLMTYAPPPIPPVVAWDPPVPAKKRA